MRVIIILIVTFFVLMRELKTLMVVIECVGRLLIYLRWPTNDAMIVH